MRKRFNKRKEISSAKEIIYSDWVDIFDAGLKKIQSLNKQPILFFSGGKDSTFIASRMLSS